MAAAEVIRLETVSGPKQARSERTLYRLLDAAEGLISEKGHADVSIPEIVQRAGSSVGGFYARFRDKNELLRALEERFYRDLDRRVEILVDAERWRGVPIRKIIEAAVAELVLVTRERQRLLAAFLFRAIQDPVLREDALRFRRGVSARFEALLLPRLDEFGHAEPRLAIDLGIQAAFALMQQHLLFGETRAGGRVLSDDELVRELTVLFMAYLGVRAEPARRKAGRARQVR